MHKWSTKRMGDSVVPKPTDPFTVQPLHLRLRTIMEEETKGLMGAWSLRCLGWDSTCSIGEGSWTNKISTIWLLKRELHMTRRLGWLHGWGKFHKMPAFLLSPTEEVWALVIFDRGHLLLQVQGSETMPSMITEMIICARDFKER